MHKATKRIPGLLSLSYSHDILAAWLLKCNCQLRANTVIERACVELVQLMSIKLLTCKVNDSASVTLR